MQIRHVVVAVVVSLAGCGGGGSPSAPVVPPATTLSPSFTGTYTGAFLFNLGGGQGVANATGTTSVTQTGTHLDFSPLQVSAPGQTSISIPIGGATLDGNSFTGGTSYNSTGCGLIQSTTDGHFAGALLNLHVTLLPTTCERSELRSELSRSGTAGAPPVTSPPAPPPTTAPPATTQPPAPPPTTRPQQPPPTTQPRNCCKVCNNGKPCGDSCIASNLTCHQPPGCACAASLGDFMEMETGDYEPLFSAASPAP